MKVTILASLLTMACSLCFSIVAYQPTITYAFIGQHITCFGIPQTHLFSDPASDNVKSSEVDNHANQMSPNNDEYWHNRDNNYDYDDDYDDDDDCQCNQTDFENHCDQMNRNNDDYWHSRE